MWISVKDKLPPLIKYSNHSDNVLAICNGKLMVMCYSYIFGDDSGYFWTNCYGDIEGDGEFDDDYDVTHWQPLPDVKDI